MSAPILAAWLVGVLLGRPDVAHDLVEITLRESLGRPIGVHARDAHLSARGWRGQVALGHLDRRCQPYEAGQWATRGAWGMSAASAWPYLPRCYRPQVLDWTVVAAVAATLRLMDVCASKRRDGWCPRRTRRVSAGRN